MNGDYTDTKKIREDCKKLVENIKIKEDKIGFDFEPDKVLQSF